MKYLVDTDIASTAVSYNMVLLSDNVKHFERIESLKLKNTNDFEEITRPNNSLTTDK